MSADEAAEYGMVDSVLRERTAEDLSPFNKKPPIGGFLLNFGLSSI